MKLSNYLLLAALSLTASCGDTGGAAQDTQDTTAKANTSIDAARDSWQASGELFTVLGGVKGKLVADLFAADGYMTFKLIEAGANVIAIDTDQKNLDAIDARKKEMVLGDDRLKTRLVEPGEAGITMAEADLALCMHRWTSITDKAAYFHAVRAGLKSPKIVGVVEFLKMETPVGPPVEQRVNEMQVMDEIEVGGFTDITGLTKKLPYQFIIIGQDVIDVPDAPGEEEPQP